MMREKMHGKLEHRFAVWCGYGRGACATIQVLAFPALAPARREAKAYGWIYRRSVGWICPAHRAATSSPRDRTCAKV